MQNLLQKSRPNTREYEEKREKNRTQKSRDTEKEKMEGSRFVVNDIESQPSQACFLLHFPSFIHGQELFKAPLGPLIIFAFMKSNSSGSCSEFLSLNSFSKWKLLFYQMQYCSHKFHWKKKGLANAVGASTSHICSSPMFSFWVRISIGFQFVYLLNKNPSFKNIPDKSNSSSSELTSYSS